MVPTATRASSRALYAAARTVALADPAASQPALDPVLDPASRARGYTGAVARSVIGQVVSSGRSQPESV